MKAKYGKIDTAGGLCIERAGKLMVVSCVNLVGSRCADHCAGFGEPEAVMVNGRKKTELQICCGTWVFDRFEDERKPKGEK